ncbi:MAG TPA: DNA mismatch repair protein MutS, partial [Acetobacteraceae bacterium]|nr:DNA mismatch repair protein MutS [Acetobacteraceae bacterium]
HEAYLARLIRRGFRVAICEQMETPEEAKRRKAATLRREVVRLVTPGTVTEDALLEAARPAWLLALAPGEGGAVGAAWLDVSTGAFETESLPAVADLPGLLARLEPVELLAPPDLAAVLPGLAGERATEAVLPRDATGLVAAAFGVSTLEGFGAYAAAEIAAAAMALDYVKTTQRGGAEALAHLSRPVPRGARGVLQMDGATRRSLEILRSERGDMRDCLLAAVDRTVTAAGGRELASRLACPLAEAEPILARHDAVAALLASARLRNTVREALRGAPDMARALGRLSLDRFAPRDLAAIRDGLGRGAAVADALDAAGGAVAPLLREAAAALRPEPDPAQELKRALAETLPARLDDPGLVAVGYDRQLDGLRRLRDDARGAIAAMQLDLAQAWGVASLKVRHHQQFGYLAEVPAAAGEKLLREAPATASRDGMAPIHRQTMANGHRFTCAALADLDRRLAEAGDAAAKRERTVARHLRDLCLGAAPGIARAAAALAEVDVHAAAAALAAEDGWCRPAIVDRPDFAVRAGRHPVVAAALARERGGGAFVPNDCDLSPGRRVCLLTGPNMAGKSTFLRQNALMVVLAQAGMFVPAEAARLGLVDRLFSRVGAADDIAGGRSTFMVEMAETAAILNQAGPGSLVVLDEVGRGTATWDGLAVAWAVLEALHDRLRCRTVFATHFHELTALAGRLPELSLSTMRVREWRGQVVFLHSVGAGAAERSWGLHVARLAGVPKAVLSRAGAVLEALEERARGLEPLSEELPLLSRGAAAAGRDAGTGTGSGDHASPASPHPALEALAALDLDSLSPREAQEALYRLRSMLNDTFFASQHALGSAE